MNDELQEGWRRLAKINQSSTEQSPFIQSDKLGGPGSGISFEARKVQPAGKQNNSSLQSGGDSKSIDNLSKDKSKIRVDEIARKNFWRTEFFKRAEDKKVRTVDAEMLEIYWEGCEERYREREAEVFRLKTLLAEALPWIHRADKACLITSKQFFEWTDKVERELGI